MRDQEDSLPLPFTRGLVEVSTGNGKGKTSTASGIVLRAASHGLKVFVVYFMTRPGVDY
ncbi:MAG: cob(I)yrinic acid a,c-diamide adenosyltransferase [Chloroflexi bacterium]|nr:cob(I)yrinic acid a,c-diamide adenosyltransferase [Chloroflexota bacterium]